MTKSDFHLQALRDGQKSGLYRFMAMYGNRYGFLRIRWCAKNFELSVEKIALIHKQRWQIELLFKQPKQNFPLRYFLGDNENAIEIQIWAVMLANLLTSLVKSKVKRAWAFSNMVSLIRKQLMSHVDIYRFLEDPEGCWRTITARDEIRYQHSLFYINRGLHLKTKSGLLDNHVKKR